MTAKRKISKNQTRKQHNNCDNGFSVRPKRDDWDLPGFTQINFNKWNYSLGGQAPVWYIRPGIVGVKDGMLATHEQSGAKVLFPYITASPKDIAERLADESLEIMRHDANLAEDELDWAKMEAEGMVIPF